MMTKYLYATLFALLALNGTAQNAKSIFDAEKLIWYGLDFTQAKMIGVKDAPDKEIVTRFYKEWNDATVYELDKFPLQSIFQKLSILYEPSITQERNANVNPYTIASADETLITPSQIENTIKEYKPGKRKEGIGVVIFIESFNKKKELAVGHLTFFDVASNKVLLTKRVTGQAGGGGLKNYWSGAISRMLNAVEKTEFDKWRKEATSK